MHRYWLGLWLAAWLGCWDESHLAMAQDGPGAPAPEQVFAGLPPEVLPKIRELAELLQQSIHNGQLSDARIHQELQSGRLDETIRGLSPEAGRLFGEIRRGLQAGGSEEALAAILQGLAPPSP